MIPLHLRLRNFMSYGEQVPPLDFSRLTTACLTGDNGHGKSALLDAITWALWGQTRAKHRDDIVRLGQTETEVEFEFELEGQRYRVLRKRILRSRGGQSSLELQGFEPQSRRYQAITGNSIRETQAKIVQLLHMNYETFINSVFILQGRADEFTTHGPADRKRILAEILGLTLYDDLETRARARRHDLDSQVKGLSLRIEDLQRQVIRKDEVAAAVAMHQDDLAQIQTGLREAHERLDSLRQRHRQVELHSQRADEISRGLQQARHDLLELEQQLAMHTSRMTDYQAVLQQEDAILSRYQTLQHLKGEERLYSVRAEQHAALQQRQNVLRQTITAARHKLELERQSAHQRLQETDLNIQSCEAIMSEAPRITRAYEALLTARQREAEYAQILRQRYALQQEKHRVEGRIQQKRHALELEQRGLIERQKEWQQKEASLPNWQQETEGLDHQLRCIYSQVQRCEQVRAEEVSLQVRIDHHIPQTLQHIEQEIDEQQEKRSLLKSAEARCPLCEKTLSQADRQGVMSKLTQEISRREARLRDLRGEKQRLQEQKQALRVEFRQLEQHIEQRQRLEQQRAAAQARVDEAQRAHDELVSLLEGLQHLEVQLTAGSYARDDLEHRQRLAAELDALAYNPQEHETVKQELAHLVTADHERARLQEAEAERSRYRERRTQQATQLEGIEHALQTQGFAVSEQIELREAETSLASLNFDPDAYRLLRQKLQENQHVERQVVELEAARQHLNDTQQAQQQLQTKTGRCRQDIEALEAQHQEYAQNLSTLESLQPKLAEAERQVENLREREGDCRLALGRTQSDYEHCLQRETDLQHVEGQRKQTVEECTLYDELAQIVGKNGIQAIIIENAIPELEEEANHILARVTDNAMHLSLETQRDTRKGEVAETLEIKISDALGTRNYELFSGGEAFRINLAIRIALAKMLARRAGARLQTLVIDEGFGTQDSQGLDRLVEVIKAVQDDFTKIIVITHLRDLKNAFDTHIEVKKDPMRGSFYQVL